MTGVIFAAASLVAKVKWLGRVLADPELSTSARAVAAALFYRHNSATGRLDPGASDLAELAGLSRRGAQNAVAELVASGYLAKVTRRASPAGEFRTNAYRLVGAATDAPPSEVAAPGAGEVTSRKPENLQPGKEPSGRVALDREGETPAESVPIRRELERRLEERIGGAAVRSWVRPAAWRGVEGGRLVLEVSGRVAADWLRRSACEIRDAAIGAGLAIAGVEIVVAAAYVPGRR